MSCYFIAHIRIHDPDEYAKYLERVDDVFAKYQGKYLAVDDTPVILEGKWAYRRIVLIEFPNQDELQRWYDSPEYRHIRQYRLTSADCTAMIVNGSG